MQANPSVGKEEKWRYRTDSIEGNMFHLTSNCSSVQKSTLLAGKYWFKKKQTNKKNPPQREISHQFLLTHSFCMNVILFPWQFSQLSSTWSLLYPFINRCCTQMNPSYSLQPLYERWMTKGEEFLCYQRQVEQRRVSWTKSTGTDWGAGLEPGGLSSTWPGHI